MKKQIRIIETIKEENLKFRDMRKFETYTDFSQADKTFEEKYGDVVAPNYFIDDDGNFAYSKMNALFRYNLEGRKEISTTDERGIIQKNYIYNGQTESSAFKTYLPYSTIYIPHEEVEPRIQRGIANLNSSGEFGELKLQKVYDSHGGYTRYWTYLSDKQHAVKVGDFVRFGITFRNGIGTSVALGGDLWSYRLSCANGAVVKDEKLGSFTAAHKGSLPKILNELVDGIAGTVLAYKELLGYYRQFTQIKLTQKNLLAIVKKGKVPYRYLPEEYVEVVTKREDKTLPNAIIKLKKNDATLWDFFNSVTNPLTRAVDIEKTTKDITKISYNIFAKRTSKLQQAMIQVVRGGGQ